MLVPFPGKHLGLRVAFGALRSKPQRHSSMENVREGGWPAFAALGVGGLAILVSVVALALALIKPRIGLILGVVALTVSFGPVAVGFGGMMWGRQQVDAI